MRICFVVDYYPPHIGGAEVFIQKLAEGLVSKGNRCVVITTRTDKISAPVEQKNTLTIVRIRTPRYMPRFWFSIMSIPAIIHFARDCDIIHGASYGGAIPTFVSAKILRKKSIFMVFEFMEGLWNNLESNWVKAAFYRCSESIIAHFPFDMFLAISRYTRNCLRLFGIPDRKLDFVYGARTVEAVVKRGPEAVRSELGFSKDDFVYMAYGRAGITKGMEYFVNAIPGILNKVPSAKFIFVFTKSDKRIWDNIIIKLKRLPENVYRFFPGLPTEKLFEYVSASDCVVVPSLSEGFGFVALEAATFAKKIVATDAGSLPEVVSGEHVFVKPASAEALIDGCLSIFRGQTDYTAPKSFSWDVTIDQLNIIYTKLIRQ
jgi:glycosyltransferase involved in cell wall biosynthesis